jgi:hypothetical protein
VPLVPPPPFLSPPPPLLPFVICAAAVDGLQQPSASNSFFLSFTRRRTLVPQQLLLLDARTRPSSVVCYCLTMAGWPPRKAAAFCTLLPLLPTSVFPIVSLRFLHVFSPSSLHPLPHPAFSVCFTFRLSLSFRPPSLPFPSSSSFLSPVALHVGNPILFFPLLFHFSPLPLPLSLSLLSLISSHPSIAGRYFLAQWFGQ